MSHSREWISSCFAYANEELFFDMPSWSLANYALCLFAVSWRAFPSDERKHEPESLVVVHRSNAHSASYRILANAPFEELLRGQETSLVLLAPVSLIYQLFSNSHHFHLVQFFLCPKVQTDHICTKSIIDKDLGSLYNSRACLTWNFPNEIFFFFQCDWCLLRKQVFSFSFWKVLLFRPLLPFIFRGMVDPSFAYFRENSFDFFLLPSWVYMSVFKYYSSTFVM